MNISVITFGCKVNRFESEQLVASLKTVANVVASSDDADVVVINGCSVTAATDAQIRNAVRKYSKKSKVIITGCYAKNHQTKRVTGDSIVYYDSIEEVAQHFGVPFRYDVSFSTSRPFIKIQDGCPQFCSYCIIPHLRGGTVRSVPIEDIRTLAGKCAQNGAQEIVLTGIHLGTYGRDLSGTPNLADAVAAVYDELPFVRMGSLESAELSERIFVYLKEGILLPHMHIPLQSGSNTVLKRMNRPDTAEQFRDTMLCIASDTVMPGLGTDVIAGFPGESDKEFEQTYELIESLPFSYGHVFPFSARPGTPAFQMEKEHPVPPPVKKERARLLRELFARKKSRYIFSLDGMHTSMILETKTDNGFIGTTERYISLPFVGNGTIGERRAVILSYRSDNLIAYPDT